MLTTLSGAAECVLSRLRTQHNGFDGRRITHPSTAPTASRTCHYKGHREEVTPSVQACVATRRQTLSIILPITHKTPIKTESSGPRACPIPPVQSIRVSKRGISYPEVLWRVRRSAHREERAKSGARPVVFCVCVSTSRDGRLSTHTFVAASFLCISTK